MAHGAGTAGQALAVALGLALTAGVPVPAGAATAPVARVRDIAARLAGCWHPPHADDQVTIRLSFARDGALIGRPRITFLRSNQGPDGDAALANSILAAVRACTPLRFTPELGGAIAGHVLAIRFIGPRRAAVTHEL